MTEEFNAYTSADIYCRDSAGATRFWRYEIDGERWRGQSGLVGEGYSVTSSGWSQAKPKNPGKKNARTAKEQAAFEAEAELRKKLDREYRRTVEELDSVPPAPMLAQKYKDLKKGLRFPGGVTPGVFVQPKLDGIRMFGTSHGGFSREYQQFGRSVDHIMDALAPVFRANPDVIFDGELYNHTLKDDFNSISSLVRKQNLDDEDVTRCQSLLQYHVYDLPSDKPFAVRMFELQNISRAFDLDLSPVVIVPTVGVDTLEQIDACYEDFLADGYEGQMIRTNEPYAFGVRSWSLLKRKEFVDIEVPITRQLMGEGNWDGIPKAIEYMLPGDKRGPDGNRPKAGIKGSQEFCRSLIDRKPKFATIRYFALTPAGIPRFPVAVDFHDEERKD